MTKAFKKFLRKPSTFTRIARFSGVIIENGKMTEKIAVLTLSSEATCHSVWYSYNLAIRADVSSPSAGFTSKDAGGMLLAQELNKEAISVQVDLLYQATKWKGKGFSCSYLFDLILRLTSGNSSILRKLHYWFQDEIKFSVELKPIVSGMKGAVFSTEEEMTIREGYYTCRTRMSDFDHSLPFFILRVKRWDLTIRIRVPDKRAGAIDAWCPKSLVNEPKTSEFLDDGFLTDVTIIAGNGAEVKAHRLMLAAASPVLQATFKNEMKESLTGRLDMSDMTEKSVKAFLRYIYGKDLSGAKADAEVAFELLLAAHMYIIPSLEKLIVPILLKIEDVKVGVELALRIYSIVKVWDPASALKEKAVGVLRLKWDELEETPEYKEMLKNSSSSTVREFFRDVAKSQIDFCDKCCRPQKTKRDTPRTKGCGCFGIFSKRK